MMSIKSIRSSGPSVLLTGLALGLLSLSAHATNLVVVVDGLRNANGTVRLELDGSEAAWNDKIAATAKGNVKAATGSVSYTFSDISPGTYGLSVYQDEDDSGKFRTSTLGIPKEGYGFSNNPSTMHMPTFQDVQFTVAQEDKTVLIHLKHGI
jgi:uncharacterized protein (DUF2141 family)